MQKSLRNSPSFNHIPFNEVWTLNVKFQAQKWITSGIFPSLFSSSLSLPFPLSASSVRHRLYFQSTKRHFFSWRKTSKSELSRQDCMCSLIWHILTDLSSLSLVFLSQPSLFVLNFHWDQQKVSYLTLTVIYKQQAWRLEGWNIFP